jgi:hypothetical protein
MDSVFDTRQNGTLATVVASNQARSTGKTGGRAGPPHQQVNP